MSRGRRPTAPIRTAEAKPVIRGVSVTGGVLAEHEQRLVQQQAGQRVVCAYPPVKVGAEQPGSGTNISVRGSAGKKSSAISAHSPGLVNACRATWRRALLPAPVDSGRLIVTRPRVASCPMTIVTSGGHGLLPARRWRSMADRTPASAVASMIRSKPLMSRPGCRTRSSASAHRPSMAVLALIAASRPARTVAFGWPMSASLYGWRTRIPGVTSPLSTR